MPTMARSVGDRSSLAWSCSCAGAPGEASAEVGSEMSATTTAAVVARRTTFLRTPNIPLLGPADQVLTRNRNKCVAVMSRHPYARRKYRQVFPLFRFLARVH